MANHTVAIVGRPNVGKSTFFNRLIGDHRSSIVDDFSGVTRDRIYGETFWNGKTFDVIDTGGFVLHSDDVFEAAIREQVLIAMDEASVILFLVDVTTGVTDLDDQMANILRRSKKPVFVVVNKVDNAKRMYEASEFYSLGFEHTFFMAAISGSGTGDLLDAVTDILPDDDNAEEGDGIPKLAIVGQPNVGKSTLVNALVGQERNIVTDVAGTTRDAIHTHYNQFGKDFILVDTAGMRKKTKVKENIEFYSVIRAIKAIEESDVCLLVIDATLGIEQQDLNILRVIEKKRKGLVIVVNKWDLVDKETNTARDLEKDILERTAPFTDIPVIFISALEKQRILKALELALKVHQRRSNRIPTSVLNNWLEESMERFRPPSVRGNYVKMNYVTQLPTPFPSFAFFTNYPKHIKKPYRNYLENRLRESFDFHGIPLTLYFRKK